MSEALNIYPFQDTETTIRFGVQVVLFLIGLAVANHFIIKPALRLQEERKKRTIGNQIVAQNQTKIAENLENSYTENLTKAIEEAKTQRDNQIKQTKEVAKEILTNAQQKAAQHMAQTTQQIAQIKSELEAEKQNASSQIYLQVNSIVKNIYSKLGVSV